MTPADRARLDREDLEAWESDRDALHSALWLLVLVSLLVAVMVWAW